IYELELDSMIQGKILKEEALTAYEMFKPANLIKTTLNEMTSPSYIFNNVFASLIGRLGGLNSKKNKKEKSDNTFQNLLNSLIKFGLTTLIVQNPTAIKLIGGSLVQYLFKKATTIFSKDDK
ncbi:MAG: hypothetical protein M0O93_06380, partial [Bacteroidales bacterium]|nr:hypothetical protein [Bacteroidales bacterium]